MGRSAPTYVIIGNGIAGLTAAETLRAENASAHIVVVDDDASPVYYRPMLKNYLEGRVHEHRIWVRPPAFYREQNIHLIKEHVVAIQPEQHTLQFQSGRQGRFTRLLLATGARAATLRCPGADLIGVTALRTLADYRQVLAYLSSVQRVVVVGSGPLALETSETFRLLGLTVIHLIRGRSLWPEVLDETASSYVLQQELSDDVDVRLAEEIVEITGTQGRVSGILTNRGERIACEMVLSAIGIEPNIELAMQSGIRCGRGVYVDELMHTSAPDIYAAGDVVEVRDDRTKHKRVMGQWFPAQQQARLAAYAILDMLDGSPGINFQTFYNATNLYGIDFAAVGLTNGTSYQELIAEPQESSYRKVVLQNNGVAIGMMALGDRREVLAFKRAIDHNISLQPVYSQLFTPGFQLQKWLDSQHVPPPILGVTRPTAAIPMLDIPAAVLREERRREQTFQLVPLSGQQEFFELPYFQLKRELMVTIGRQANADLIIDEQTVSRKHATICYEDGSYNLRDLDSKNGTFVNEKWLEPYKPLRLKVNDLLCFGKVVQFVFAIAPPQTESPEPDSAMTLAGASAQAELKRNTIISGQPVLNADGSLQLPGSVTTIAAAVVATFKTAPVLIVLPGKTQMDGNRPPMVYMLRSGMRTTIGRDKENTIALADNVLSRRHAEIVQRTDGFYIRDLSSSNGILVNKHLIESPYRLAHGDYLMLGSSLIYFIDLRNHHGILSQNETRTPKRPSTRTTALVEAVSMQQVNSMTDRQQSGAMQQLAFCPHCGIVNIRSARFCAGCSTSLHT